MIFAKFPIVLQRRQSHPYDVPEIIELPIVKGNRDYLNWVSEVTSKNY